MKFDLNSKMASVAYLIASHATTAKSFLPRTPLHTSHHQSICFKRPYNCNVFQVVEEPLLAVNSKTTAVTAVIQPKSILACQTILSLRAGATIDASALTIVTSSLNTFFKKNPYAAAFFICGLQASAADLIAQKTSRNEETENAVEIRGGTDTSANIKTMSSFQIKRNLAFLLYGGIYQGCFQEHLFNKIFPMIFGEGNSLLTVGLKVSFDMLIVSPFLCLPVAYLIKGIIYRLSLIDSIHKYIHDVRENGLLKTYWTIWWPVQAFNFMLVPKQFRISFIACFSFFWLIMLSAISGKSEKVA